LKPEWVELREVPDALDLNDECLDVVRLYVQWLYSGSLGTRVPRRVCRIPEQDISIWTSDEPFEALLAKLPANLRNIGIFPSSDEADEAVLMLLANAYIFGDKRLDVPFKNAVLVKLAQVSRAYKSTPSTKILEVIFAGTCPGSPL
jgi:hypothetical protein